MSTKLESGDPEDNFKLTYKYYKSRQPPPNLFNVVDIFKGTYDMNQRELRNESRANIFAASAYILEWCIYFFSESSRNQLEILASQGDGQNQNKYSHAKFDQMGINPIDKWKTFKVQEKGLNGIPEFTGLIVISNALNDTGQLLWSLRWVFNYM